MKPIIQGGLGIAAFTLSIFLIFSERSHNGVADSVRASLLDGLVPVLDVLSKPVDALERGAQAVGDYWAVYDENAQLKLENERLLQWQTAALNAESENQSLRELLNYHPAQATSFVSAKVVGNAGNSLAHRIRIDAGAMQGVKKHQAVMNERGLLGRVISVGRHSAEVLLITDMNSRVPVMTEPGGLRAILAGDRSDLPHLTLASSRKAPGLGEMVVTASDGQIFPAGLPIGKVFSEANGHWNVRPLADLATLRFVRVVSFDRPATAFSKAASTDIVKP